MNPLSVKADSFFEHPSQRQGYAQLARSRPGTLKDVERCVFVPIHHEPAAAPVDSNAQIFGDERATPRAFLAGVVPGHFFNLSPGPFSLELEGFDEEIVTHLVPVFVAQIDHPGVQPANPALRLASILAALFLPGESIEKRQCRRQINQAVALPR